MKRLMDTLKFSSKVFFLLVILAFGWVFINVTNFVKGKKWGDKTGSLLGPESADADVPATTLPPTNTSTPFLAYYDGKEYKLENDILFGRPKSYCPIYEHAKKLYEDGRISPDLYKITAPIKPYDEKIKFQLQEIEPEESYFKWLELKRITHPADTEVIVDSEFKKFYVLQQKTFEKNIILPTVAIVQNKENLASRISDKSSFWQPEPEKNKGVFLESKENIEITFRGLRPSEAPFLIIKSWYRDWVPGFAENWKIWEETRSFSWISLKKSFSISSLIYAPIFLAALYLQRKGLGGEFLAATPFVFGVQSQSLVHEYKDQNGQYRKVSVTETRGWKYNTELIEFPRGAILSNGELHLRIQATKRHAVGFVGVITGDRLKRSEIAEYREENLPLFGAYHRRFEKDFFGLLHKKNKEYMQTIPGDTVDLEFGAETQTLKKDEKETYLMRSSGFYTSLRPKNRRIAGKWQDKISKEARERLDSLLPLREYRQ